MDTIDPFEDFHEFDDCLPPVRASFGTQGVRIKDLEKGAELEFDPHAYDPIDNDRDQNDNKRNGFKPEDIWRHLNPDCIQHPEEDDLMTPFLSMEAHMIDLTEGSKLVFKKILRSGVGEIVPQGATAKIHYNGYLEYSDEPYDSTRLRNKPLTVRLGNEQVILGLELGVASMRKSEIARILVKSDYAFGKMGCPPRIPPEATILFEVEVLSFIDHQAADCYEELPEEERVKITLQELVGVANAEREAGNDFFTQRMYNKAQQRYLKAINMLEPAHLKNEEEEGMWAESLVKLYLNLSLCNLRTKKPKPAITNCKRVLELDNNNLKATFRLGKAYGLLCEWSEAKKYMLRAINMSPNNTELRQELATLDRKIKNYEVMEKGLYKKMFETSSQSSGPQNSNNELDDIPEELKTSLKEKLMLFQANNDMYELVLPVGTKNNEIYFIEKMATELELKTIRGRKGSNYSVKVIKPHMKPEHLYFQEEGQEEVEEEVEEREEDI